MLDTIRSFTAISNGADIEMIQRWDRRLGQYARALSLNHLAGQLAPIEIGVIVNNRTYPFLTEYENRVLRLVAQGLTNKEIAQSLLITPRTVEFHLQRIFKKLNVTCRTAAAVAAAEMGLLK